MARSYISYLGDEDHLQNQVIKYVSMKYRVKPIPMNIEHKKSDFEQFKSKYLGFYSGIVDLFIPYPKRPYNGLFIELKTSHRKVFKKDSTELLKQKSDTHSNQLKELQRHRDNGYYAVMTFGIDKTIEVIDNYFKGEPKPIIDWFDSIFLAEQKKPPTR